VDSCPTAFSRIKAFAGRLLAALMLLSMPCAVWPDRVQPLEEETGNQIALVIADYSQCGRGDFLLFTVLWKGRVGVMTEPLLIGWDPPRPGDRLTGNFLEEGGTEIRFLDTGETTLVRILKTGIPVDQQGALRMEICGR
jgi:hypothetical protein